MPILEVFENDFIDRVLYSMSPLRLLNEWSDRAAIVSCVVCLGYMFSLKVDSTLRYIVSVK